MPTDLSQIIIAEHNAQAARLLEMYRAIARLYADLTPDELAIWNDLQERGKQLRKGSAEAQREIALLRNTDPVEFIGRLHASIERDAAQTKLIADELLKLVKNHPHAVREWKRKNPPYRPKQIRRRPK